MDNGRESEVVLTNFAMYILESTQISAHYTLQNAEQLHMFSHGYQPDRGTDSGIWPMILALRPLSPASLMTYRTKFSILVIKGHGVRRIAYVKRLAEAADREILNALFKDCERVMLCPLERNIIEA